MTRFLTVVFLSLTLLSCRQNTLTVDKDKEQLDKVCDTFMQIFSKGQFKEAIDLLKKNSVLESEKLDSLLVTIQNHSTNAFPAYGKMISAEFIGERMIKNYIGRRFYILKFDKYPIKFDFTLYNGTKCWTITSFKYNEELDELFN